MPKENNLLVADMPIEEHRGKLADLSARLDQHHFFAKDQFVKWKPGLKNRKYPGYAEPVIVRAVLAKPIFDSAEDATSPNFLEPLTLVIGAFIDGTFLEFRVDGRRFEPFKE